MNDPRVSLLTWPEFDFNFIDGSQISDLQIIIKIGTIYFKPIWKNL